MTKVHPIKNHFDRSRLGTACQRCPNILHKMLFWTTTKLALKSISANKMRSALTVLGVIIGVASVIAMLALGAGTREKVTESMRAFGANLLVVRPGQRAGSSGVRTATQQNLRLEDAEAILRQVQEVEMVTPDIDESMQVKFMNHNVRVTVNGEAVPYFAMRNFVIEKGRSFTEDEVNKCARVAVLGPKTAQDLFDAGDPLGQYIKIRHMNVLVIGVTRSKGGSGWSNPDENIWLPYTTAMKQLFGRENLNQIYCRVRDHADMTGTQEKITAVMRRQHRIQAEAPEDFSIRNMQEITDSLEQVSNAFTFLLAGVAGVSLLVGGVNIMNIMLVTVTERTREIGVRKALGARSRDVLTQFLIEALTISMSGGMIGVALGLSSVILFNSITESISGTAYGAKLQLWPVLISFSFSALVGVFFGWYPARKAASLDPIESLRFE